MSRLFAIDTELAKARYAKLASKYDIATRHMEPVRRQAIAELRLQRGDRVLDVACGTGKSFALIQEAIGDGGELIGVEQSSQMMAHARRRVQDAGWRNVTVLEASVEDAVLEGTFDAVLFVYTQDVLQSPAALDNVFSHAAGARVVSTGLKLYPWYLGVANVYLLAVSWPYFTSFKGLVRPWRLLSERISDLRVRSTHFGSGYIAVGRHP